VISAFSFLFGAVIGSFLNVCIYRLPRGESIVWPGSHCTHCQRAIAPYDNLPLLSYLWLKGRCRHCQAAFSPHYFLVELATGLLFLSTYRQFGLSPIFFKLILLNSLLIVLVVTDWRERLLPDKITFPGIMAALLLSLWVPVGDGSALWLARAMGLARIPVFAQSLLDALLGALAGGGLLYALSETYLRLRHREGLGFGDVKMMAMVGAFLGPKLTLLTILLGSLSGSVLGLVFILLFRKGALYELPFGTFLGVSAYVASLYGWQILHWYAGFFP
jgi:leader peptidase (prepilin peptidase)/N-methyltransferase